MTKEEKNEMLEVFQ